MTTPNLARARRWGESGRSDPLCRYVGPRIGLTPASAEQLLRGPRAINLRCAAYVEGFRKLQDEIRLARFMAPILRAYEQREAPPLVPAVWNIAQAADAKEDVDEVAYHLDPTDGNLERLIRSTEIAVIREMAKLDALRAEQQRRRGRA